MARSSATTGSSLPDLENLDKADGGPTVHPARRRRGIGRELLRHEGRGRSGTAGPCSAPRRPLAAPETAFAQAVGARLDLEEVRRIQYLREISAETIASLRATAEKAAAEYSLVSWTGAGP